MASLHLLICCFMKGGLWLLPVSRPLVHLWDLPMVLEGLKNLTLELLQGADLRFVHETVWFLALALAKRISDIHAVFLHQLCPQFVLDDVRIQLLVSWAVPSLLVRSCWLVGGCKISLG